MDLVGEFDFLRPIVEHVRFITIGILDVMTCVVTPYRRRGFLLLSPSVSIDLDTINYVYSYSLYVYLARESGPCFVRL